MVCWSNFIYHVNMLESRRGIANSLSLLNKLPEIIIFVPSKKWSGSSVGRAID
jgi:hypothetical protein